MNIILATTSHPFVDGGATYIVDWLERVLLARGHSVETFRFPFSDDPATFLSQSLALRLIDLSQHGDRLITIRTPSHLLRHPRKVTWFIHHFRSAYDLWGTKYQSIPNTAEGVGCRDAIRSADNVGLKEASKVFCNSKVVQKRLHKFNGVDAEVLYPPLLATEQYRCETYGDFLLYLSRLTHHKRQWLAIQALRHTKSPVRLCLAGAADPTCLNYVSELRDLAEKCGVADRVQLLPRWIPDKEKADLYARCLACVYLPFDEDSYGYPSLEAHYAGKAVLTASDSGGTVELIVDGFNGRVTPSDPELLAAAMDELFWDRRHAQLLGENGLRRVNQLGISWDHVVSRLLA